MRELMRTDDAVLVSFVETLLGEAGMHVEVLDRNMSALYVGAGGLQQRIFVPDGEWPRAKQLLVEAQLGKWVIEPGDT